MKLTKSERRRIDKELREIDKKYLGHLPKELQTTALIIAMEFAEYRDHQMDRLGECNLDFNEAGEIVGSAIARTLAQHQASMKFSADMLAKYGEYEG